MNETEQLLKKWADDYVSVRASISDKRVNSCHREASQLELVADTLKDCIQDLLVYKSKEIDQKDLKKINRIISQKQFY